MIPLADAPVNELLRIERLMGVEKNVRHLQSLGFTKNANLTLVKNDHGDVVIIIGSQKIAMNQISSSQIFVCKVEKRVKI